MNVDWLLILNIFRILFALVILCFASYYDIKTRRVSNISWVILGLTGITLLECQVILKHGLDAFYYIMPIIPLTGLFMSFLVCDWVVDFDEKKINEPWVFIILLSGFVFFYLILFGPTGNEEHYKYASLLIPIILFLLYYMCIQVLHNYLEYRAYLRHLSSVNKTAGKKNPATVKAKNNANKQKNFEKHMTPEERSSWAVFFALLALTLMVFLMTDIITIILIHKIGLIIMALIPVILIILYYHYHQLETSSCDVAEVRNTADSGQDITNGESPEDRPDMDEHYDPPNQLIYYFTFFGLIFFGFVILIYYSIQEQLSNHLVQVSIMMIWILILYGFYNLGMPRGGADTKALMALIILFPIYPIIQYITLNTPFYSLLDQHMVIASLFPFAFSVLVNGAFISLFFILGQLIYNASKRDLKFPHALLGYKLTINKVPKKFVWLMERYRDGKRKLMAFPSSDINLGQELKLFKKAGVKKVWVTPKIPFIIPLTIALVITVIIGNIIFIIIGI